MWSRVGHFLLFLSVLFSICLPFIGWRFLGDGNPWIMLFALPLFIFITLAVWEDRHETRDIH